MIIELTKTPEGYEGFIKCGGYELRGSGEEDSLVSALKASYIKSENPGVETKEMYRLAKDLDVDIIYK